MLISAEIKGLYKSGRQLMNKADEVLNRVRLGLSKDNQPGYRRHVTVWKETCSEDGVRVYRSELSESLFDSVPVVRSNDGIPSFKSLLLAKAQGHSHWLSATVQQSRCFGCDVLCSPDLFKVSSEFHNAEDQLHL